MICVLQSDVVDQILMKDVRCFIGQLKLADPESSLMESRRKWGPNITATRVIFSAADFDFSTSTKESYAELRPETETSSGDIDSKTNRGSNTDF
jgi:hypothetical protein